MGQRIVGSSLMHLRHCAHQLSIKIQNIALQEELESKIIRIKWHLWRGRTDNALTRLDELISLSPSTHKSRLEKLKTYIKN